MFRPIYDVCSRHFSYDPKTGVVVWRLPTAARIAPGTEAGSKRRDGYRRISFKGGTVATHRLAWLLHYGCWPNGDIDHINRVRDDNRIDNLRVVTASENARNRDYRRPGEMRHGGSGITFNKRVGKWQVQVHCPRRMRAIYGGLFPDKASASVRAGQMRREFDV